MFAKYARWITIWAIGIGMGAGLLDWHPRPTWVAENAPSGVKGAAPESLGVTIPHAGQNSTRPVAQAKSPSPVASTQPAANPAPPASLPQPVVAFTNPEGTEAVPHVVKRGESVPSLAWRYLPDSIYMRRDELENAIRQANGLRGNALKPDAAMVIPGIPLQPILDKPVTVPKDFLVRGIYLTAYTAGSVSGLELIKHWKDAGGNAVVFDIKDFDGELHVPFEHQYAPHADVTIRNLPKFIHYVHSFQMHAIARIALFRDAHLAQTYPELAVHSRKTGKPWLENGKLAWTDPSAPAVQQYDLDLARMAAGAGADEIQFDYVRFPAEGDQEDAQFAYQKEHPDWPRTKIITDFVGLAYDTLHPLGVLVSIDVFGVMAWAEPIDLRHTGQDIPSLARHCDVLSPMIYPSHFFGFEGYALPGDAPEHFITESMQRFEDSTKGSGVVIRPWLQAFGWRTKTYSAGYVVTQVRVAGEQGGIGYLFWNARNDYSKPFEAMPQVRAMVIHPPASHPEMENPKPSQETVKTAPTSHTETENPKPSQETVKTPQ